MKRPRRTTRVGADPAPAKKLEGFSAQAMANAIAPTVRVLHGVAPARFDMGAHAAVAPP
jgi:hypothetical protein